MMIRSAKTVSRSRGGFGGLRGIVRATVGLCLAVTGTAAVAADNAVTNMDYNSLSGNRVRITLTLEKPAQNPNAFTIQDPARIAIDLPDTETRLADKNLSIGVGVVQDVTALEANGRSRVVVKLAELVPYELTTEGNKLYIDLEGAGASVASRASFGDKTSADGAHEITNVDFRRGEDGAGLIQIDMSDPGTPVNIRQEGNRLVADFYNTEVAERLRRRLDVTDFATPVRTIDISQSGEHVRVAVTPSDEDYEQIAYQAGDLFTLEFKPVSAEEQARRQAEPQYTGERLSLNFQDIEVRSVLQLIADFTGLNVVVSDSVSGNITLRLQDVPWDQALDIILQTKGLDMRRQGNVILVAPATEISAYERQELEAQAQLSKLKPIRSEFIQVNYAKAQDIASLLTSGAVTVKGNANTGEFEATGNGDTLALLSERGTVTVDERTNTLIVQDTADNLAQIRQLVARLDVPVRQVLIESRIVIASDDFSKDLGVRFGVAVDKYYDNGDNYTFFGGSNSGYTDFGGAHVGWKPDGGDESGLIVDLPVTDPAGAFSLAVGKLGTYLLQLELSAMETEGRGDIVSSPRVITANQKAATIETGVEIPYLEASSSGATSITFKKAVLGLTVTPQITPDDRVLLDLAVSKDSPGISTPIGPAINTQSVTTQVLVDNGETVVLGGVYERTNTDAVRRVPLFGELPMVGPLFRNTTKVDRRSELLVFVTPKILQESLSAR